MKITKVLVAILAILSTIATNGIAMEPSELEATLAPGESVTEDKTVYIPEISPKADVVFAFDLTGSMGGIINTAKTRSVDIMDNLSALGIDIDFGVMSYMDYPHSYSSYGYSAQYGTTSWGCGDYAYSLDQALTSDTSAVNTSINSLVLGCGSDGPQDYTRIFYESYADSNVSWRSGSKKILVNFGDNVPHDNNLSEGVPGKTGNWSTGGDPGRDEVMFTADDLDLQTVLANMAANNVILMESHTTTWNKDYWDYWTGLTGGNTFITTSANLVDAVVGNITAGLSSSSVTNLHLEASSGYESWLDSVTPASYSGPTNVTVDFEITIEVPEGTSDGVYTFTITAMDDDGVSYGEQNVTITVVSTIEVDIDIKPGSYPNSINLNNKGVVPVAILTTDDFDASTVDPATVKFGPGEASIVHSGHLGDVDGDGDIDLVLHFNTLDTGIQEGDTEAGITGKTYDGKDIEGTDSVRTIVGGKGKGKK